MSRRCRFALVLCLFKFFCLLFCHGLRAVGGCDVTVSLTVVSFCASCHLLHTQTSVIKPESRTNVWVWRRKFQGQFDSVSTERNNHSRLFPRACKLPGHRFLDCSVKHVFPPVEQALNPTTKQLVTPVTLMHPCDRSCHSCHYYSSQGSQLGRLLMALPSASGLGNVSMAWECESRLAGGASWSVPTSSLL